MILPSSGSLTNRSPSGLHASIRASGTRAQTLAFQPAGTVKVRCVENGGRTRSCPRRSNGRSWWLQPQRRCWWSQSLAVGLRACERGLADSECSDHCPMGFCRPVQAAAIRAIVAARAAILTLFLGATWADCWERPESGSRNAVGAEGLPPTKSITRSSPRGTTPSNHRTPALFGYRHSRRVDRPQTRLWELPIHPLDPSNDSDVILIWPGVPAVAQGKAMSATLSKALVRAILRHAEDFPWKMLDIGLMGLCLDDRREYRLHVWDPATASENYPSMTTRMTSPRRSLPVS